MRVLLDENIPLALLKHLAATRAAEHLITLGLRGMRDEEIRARLLREDLLFVTQDDEFLSWEHLPRGSVLVSRVAQSRPLAERVRLWSRAIEQVRCTSVSERLWELLDSGELSPWTQV